LLFFSKNKSVFKSLVSQTEKQEGLTYGNEILGNLVNKDTDLDGVLDWEESLWGTDPTKKDTDGDGTEDDVEIEDLKKEAGQSESLKLSLGQGAENLTETDKFSRELFTTIVTLNQNGQIDQATVDKLSESVFNQIQNSIQKKVFLISDLKLINNDNKQAIQKYSDALNNIYTKYPIEKGMVSILQKLIADEENTDLESELNPIINQENKIISELVKMSVPQPLSLLHLNLINTSQKLIENIYDMRFFHTDVILAMSAMSQYEENSTALDSAANKLAEAIRQKLNN